MKRLSDYYSQPSNKVVGSIDYGFISRIPSGIRSCDAAKVSHHPQSASRTRMNRTINFSSLWGEWHWRRTYKRVYAEQQGMWLTPCELFTPYYSNILANFVCNSMKTSLNNLEELQVDSGGTFEIVELGGGRGTNANALLNYMKENHREMYDRLDSYTIYDTSPTLHELQREVLISINDEVRVHAHKIKLVNVDLMNIAEGSSPFLTQSNIPTAVIALELLDNLPHDKIGRCIESRNILQAEALSGPTTMNSLKLKICESFVPLEDKLLHDILSMAPALYAPLVSQGPKWVPTVALGVLLALFDCRPNSSVVFADFDWLPPPDASLGPALAEPAEGDPLITDMTGKDHSCYLTSPPDALCDILFPTDFGRLAAFVGQITAKSQCQIPVSVLSMKQNEFLLKYGKSEVERTRSWLTGYSPLIHDFANCSVLEVSPQ
ncbi:hypothetical protein HJC23_000900 [Cyclotella cryptica]|uniref:Protein arginine methyltransferase NDUFAF7 n=1 Tax=Cyclotella cryptica TaxID=29204 RepID=A0ABD3PTY7_9STRA